MILIPSASEVFEWSPEITPSVADISPLGQLVIVFLLGAVIHEESLQASPMGDPDVAVDFSPVSDRASI